MPAEQLQPSRTIRPKRRWFQYSLRGLLVVVTLLAIALGIIVAPVERQRSAVQAIRDAGGRVGYGSKRSEKPFLHAPEWMRKFLGDDYYLPVVLVDLSHKRITSETLEYVQRLSDLQMLELDDTPLTDADLERFKKLTKLEFLSLYDTQIGDAGLAYLQGLIALKGLRLSGNKISNAGLKYLVGLPNLEAIYLSDTTISDAGLEHLAGLPSLRELRLYNSRVSSAGVAALQAALPSCDINY